MFVCSFHSGTFLFFLSTFLLLRSPSFILLFLLHLLFSLEGPETEIGKELLDAQKENWDLLLDRAFGVKANDDNIIDLETCRSIAISVASKIQSSDFTSNIELKVGTKTDPMEKQAALMVIIISFFFESFTLPGLLLDIMYTFETGPFEEQYLLDSTF